MGVGVGCLNVIGGNLSLRKIMCLCWVNLPPIYFLHVTEKEEKLEGARDTIKLNIVKRSIKKEFKIKGTFFLSNLRRGMFHGIKILNVVYFFISKHPLLDTASEMWVGLQFTDMV